MEHEDLWLLFDELVSHRPLGDVILLKVEAHKAISAAKDHFEVG